MFYNIFMVEIKGIRFNVVITKKKIKNIYLKLDGDTIEASCPYYVPQYEVYKFIESKSNWIYKVYMYNSNRPKNILMYRGGDTFYIFGKEYKLVRFIGRKKVSIEGDTIYFTYKDDGFDGIKALYKYLDSMLINKAKEYFEMHRNMLVDYGYIDMPNINSRMMTSKWGVCYTRNNKITINSYLIHYPLICLEYIMVHEMTHFIIPNHSKRFYEIVSNNMPNYKDANELLR